MFTEQQLNETIVKEKVSPGNKKSYSPGSRAGFMMLIKFIRFSLPVSPSQLPGATEEVSATPASKLPPLRVLSCTPPGPQPTSAPSGAFHMCSDKPKPVSLPGLVRSVFPASTDLPSRKAGPHSAPLSSHPPHHPGPSGLPLVSAGCLS